MLKSRAPPKINMSTILSNANARDLQCEEEKSMKRLQRKKTEETRSGRMLVGVETQEESS